MLKSFLKFLCFCFAVTTLLASEFPNEAEEKELKTDLQFVANIKNTPEDILAGIIKIAGIKNIRKELKRKMLSDVYGKDSSTDHFYSQEETPQLDTPVVLYQLAQQKDPEDTTKALMIAGTGPKEFEDLFDIVGACSQQDITAYPFPRGLDTLKLWGISEILKTFHDRCFHFLVNQKLGGNHDFFIYKKESLKTWRINTEKLSRKELFDELVSSSAVINNLVWKTFCHLREFFITKYFPKKDSPEYRPEILSPMSFFLLGCIHKDKFIRLSRSNDLVRDNMGLKESFIKDCYVHFKMKEDFLLMMNEAIAKIPYTMSLLSQRIPGYGLKKDKDNFHQLRTMQFFEFVNGALTCTELEAPGPEYNFYIEDYIDLVNLKAVRRYLMRKKEDEKKKGEKKLSQEELKKLKDDRKRRQEELLMEEKSSTSKKKEVGIKRKEKEKQKKQEEERARLKEKEEKEKERQKQELKEQEEEKKKKEVEQKRIKEELRKQEEERTRLKKEKMIEAKRLEEEKKKREIELKKQEEEEKRIKEELRKQEEDRARLKKEKMIEAKRLEEEKKKKLKIKKKENSERTNPVKAKEQKVDLTLESKPATLTNAKLTQEQGSQISEIKPSTSFSISPFQEEFRKIKTEFEKANKLLLGDFSFHSDTKYTAFLQDYSKRRTLFIQKIIEAFEKDHPLPREKHVKEVMAFIELGSGAYNFCLPSSDLEFAVLLREMKMEYITWLSELTKAFREVGLVLDKENLFPAIIDKGSKSTTFEQGKGSIFTTLTTEEFLSLFEMIPERDSRWNLSEGTTMNSLFNTKSFQEADEEVRSWIKQSVVPVNYANGFPYDPSRQNAENVIKALNRGKLIFGNKKLWKSFVDGKKETFSKLTLKYKGELEKKSLDSFDDFRLDNVKFLFDKFFQKKFPKDKSPLTIQSNIYRPFQLVLSYQNSIFKKELEQIEKEFGVGLGSFMNYVAFLRMRQEDSHGTVKTIEVEDFDKSLWPFHCRMNQLLLPKKNVKNL